MTRRPGPRPVVIGTCALSSRGIDDTNQRLADGLAMLDAMAAEARARGWTLDLVVLPETFASAEIAEPLDGRIVTAVAGHTRQLDAWAVIPLRLQERDRISNAAVLLDPRGQPHGIYRKAFPVVLPDGTVEGGTTPGSEFPVFNLPWGRLGVQICFDVGYDEGWQALAAQGAEVIVFPSDSPSTALLTAQAVRARCYAVAATVRAPAIVVDPLGREIARCADDRSVTVVRVDLDYRVLPSRFLWTRGDELRQRYGDTLDYGWHSDEGVCLLTSTDPAHPVGRVVEDEGLETFDEFLARNRVAQDEARGGPVARLASLSEAPTED